MESDRSLIEALKDQRSQYSLTTFDNKGRTETVRIGSTNRLLFAPDEPQAVIDKLSQLDVKIVTLTITEAGHNIELATGRFKTGSPLVEHDVQHPDRPRTVFGYLIAALARGFRHGIIPLTLLSCDNFVHNGDAARTAFVAFAHFE